MPLQNFVASNPPAIGATWLNAIDNFYFTLFNSATTAAAARTAIGAVAVGSIGLTLISRQSASNSASIDFTSISNSVYDTYLIVCSDVAPTSAGSTVRLRISLGGVFQTGILYTHNHFRFTDSSSGIDGSVSDTSACISSSVEPLASFASFFGEIKFSNCGSVLEKRWLSNSSYISNAALNIVDTGGGRIATTAAIDGFRLYMSAGNISSGTFALYGLQKS